MTHLHSLNESKYKQVERLNSRNILSIMLHKNYSNFLNTPYKRMWIYAL
jgi:hypothetical protein